MRGPLDVVLGRRDQLCLRAGERADEMDQVVRDPGDVGGAGVAGVAGVAGDDGVGARRRVDCSGHAPPPLA